MVKDLPASIKGPDKLYFECSCVPIASRHGNMCAKCMDAWNIDKRKNFHLSMLGTTLACTVSGALDIKL